MFSVEPMVKVRVACSKKNTPRVIDALYSFGTIQVSQSSTFELDKPLDSFASISTALVRVRAVESSLKLPDSAGQANEKLSLESVLKECRALPLDLLEEKNFRLRQLSEEKQGLLAKKRELALFRNLDVKPSLLKSERLDFAFFELPGKFSELMKGVSKLKAQAVETCADNKRFVLLAFDKRQSEEIKAVLEVHAGKQYPLPAVEESFAAEFHKADSQLKLVEKKQSDLEAELNALKSEWGGKIVSARKNLEWHFKKAELPTKFGASLNLNLIEGWIPERLFPRLESKLEKAAGEQIVVERMETRETPPTKLRNASAVQPFEFLIQFFSLPRYNEIDPTFFTAFFFPIFFGMIVGDIGYGLVFLALSLFLLLKNKTGFLRSIGGMMLAGAVTTILFGLFYAEFFGMEEIFGFELHPMLSRIEPEGVEVLMALTVLVGFVHLAFGLVVGFFEALKEGQRKHAGAKLSWLFLEIGLVALIVQNMDIVFFELLKPLAGLNGLASIVALAGLAGLMYFESPVAIFEIPSLFANMLSYLRIMAIGLTGVILAGMINGLKPSVSFTPEGIILFVLMGIGFTAGHIVNMVISIFEAGIQSLRLHYVEFYSKFYKGGGLPFVPLKSEESEK